VSTAELGKSKSKTARFNWRPPQKKLACQAVFDTAGINQFNRRSSRICRMKALLSLVTLLSSLALAQAQMFTINLDGAQDGGGARAGTGSGTLTLSGTALSLNNIVFSGLSANITAAHIHGAALPGLNAGVLYGIDGATFLTKNGDNRGGVFNGIVNLTDPTGNGTVRSVAQQFTELNQGRWYINVHSAAFPGGEIRGQIVPVPEPSTYALMGLGAGALLVWRRRRNS
jgi:hypothetical protein